MDPMFDKDRWREWMAAALANPIAEEVTQMIADLAEPGREAGRAPLCIPGPQPVENPYLPADFKGAIDFPRLRNEAGEPMPPIRVNVRMPDAPDPAAKLFMRREIAVTVQLDELRAEVTRLEKPCPRCAELERALLAERSKAFGPRPGEVKVGWDPEGE